MQIEQTVLSAEGRGKTVTGSVNHNTHTGTATYHGSVSYSGDPHLDFNQAFDTSERLRSWFGVWSKLTEPAH